MTDQPTTEELPPRPDIEHEHEWKFEQGHVDHHWVCACGERVVMTCVC